MYTFLVLGLIPGTNIQIGFWGWIIIMVGLTLLLGAINSSFSNTLMPGGISLMKILKTCRASHCTLTACICGDYRLAVQL